MCARHPRTAPPAALARRSVACPLRARTHTRVSKFVFTGRSRCPRALPSITAPHTRAGARATPVTRTQPFPACRPPLRPGPPHTAPLMPPPGWAPVGAPHPSCPQQLPASDHSLALHPSAGAPPGPRGRAGAAACSLQSAQLYTPARRLPHRAGPPRQRAPGVPRQAPRTGPETRIKTCRRRGPRARGPPAVSHAPGPVQRRPRPARALSWATLQRPPGPA